MRSRERDGDDWQRRRKAPLSRIVHDDSREARELVSDVHSVHVFCLLSLCVSAGHSEEGRISTEVVPGRTKRVALRSNVASSECIKKISQRNCSITR